MEKPNPNIYRTDWLTVLAHDSLSFTRNWQIIGAAVVVAGFYIFILGPSLVF